MYYSSPTILTKPVGNNALSYNQRKLLGSGCELYIPQLIPGNRDDIKVGEKIVFEEVDHRGKLQQCIGLEALLEIPSTHSSSSEIRNCFVIDNHNHALYLRYREHIAGRLGAGAMLIHIDQHADMGIPESGIVAAKCADLDYIATYTNEVCNVGNFIQPAIDSGLVGDIVQIRSVSKLLEVSKSLLPEHNYILDVDIDFRSDHIPSTKEVEAIKLLQKQASVCTIALSPFFIDIHRAINITKMIFAE